MDKLFKSIALVLMLSLGGCDLLGEEDTSMEDKNNLTYLSALYFAFSKQYCQGLGNPPITLTVGVQSATINSHDQCFLVDTSGPVTVQVTTSGTNSASIGFYVPDISGVLSDDPSVTIPSAQIGAQFLVSIGLGNTYTVLVN